MAGTEPAIAVHASGRACIRHLRDNSPVLQSAAEPGIPRLRPARPATRTKVPKTVRTLPSLTVLQDSPTESIEATGAFRNSMPPRTARKMRIRRELRHFNRQTAAFGPEPAIQRETCRADSRRNCTAAQNAIAQIRTRLGANTKTKTRKTVPHPDGPAPPASLRTATDSR